MSTAEHPPDWWLASDGNYYPPETHPDYVAAQESSANAQPAEPDATTTAGATAPTGDPASTPWQSQNPPEPENPEVTEPFTNIGSWPAEPEEPKRRANKSSLVVGTITIVVLVVLAIILVTDKAGNSGLFSLGSESANIQWTRVASNSPTAPQPFAGTLDGKQLTGTAYPASAGDQTNTANATATGVPPIYSFAQWQGTLGGKPFDIKVTQTFGKGGLAAVAAGNLSTFSYSATGTYDNMNLAASAKPVQNSAKNYNTVDLSGSIGSYKFLGSLQTPIESVDTGSTSVTFTLDKIS